MLSKSLVEKFHRAVRYQGFNDADIAWILKQLGVGSVEELQPQDASGKLGKLLGKLGDVEIRGRCSFFRLLVVHGGQGQVLNEGTKRGQVLH